MRSPTPDGGKRNSFQNAGDHIYYSPSTGTNEIGGAIFDKWGQFGYETGALGYPTSDEITNPDGGKRNSFQNAGDHIYWSPTTPASEVGGAIFDKWGNDGYETGKHGYPTTDEIDNTGPWAQWGSRRNDFQSGSIYYGNGVIHDGQWASMSAGQGPVTAAQYVSNRPAPAASGQVTPNFRTGCPPGTSAYPPDPVDLTPWNCLTVYLDPSGTTVGLREGRQASKGAFGRYHYIAKHYVEDRWVELIIQDTPAVNEPDRDPNGYVYNSETIYGENYAVDDQIVTGIRVAVNQAEAQDPEHPDTYNQGILTAYCTDQSQNPITLCPERLPSPFLRFQSYPPDPNVTFHN